MSSLDNLDQQQNNQNQNHQPQHHDNYYSINTAHNIDFVEHVIGNDAGDGEDHDSMRSNFDPLDLEQLKNKENVYASEINNEPCFVAVHIGAGYHSSFKTGAYRELCEQVCANVIEILKQGCNARTAVATAVALLEVNL